MQKRTKSEAIPSTAGPRLAALVTGFLVGAAIGSYFAAGISGVGREYMTAYINGGPGPAGFTGIATVAACELALLLAVFLSAFFRVGVVVPPLALCAKGFMLSLLITAFVRAFGATGFFAAISALVFYGFVPVVCLVLISLQALAISSNRKRAGARGRFYTDKSFYIATVLCAAAAVLAAALHVYLTPALGRLVAYISIT